VLDLDHLRAHYDKLDDQELERVAGTELVPEARAVLEQEMTSRGLALTAPRIDDGSTAQAGEGVSRNPYTAPRTVIEDPHAWAIVTMSGLVRLFQVMAVTSAVIGMFVFGWSYLPIPVDPAVLAYRNEAAWVGALAPQWSYLIFMLLQPLWMLSAFGLCFFKWWARSLLVGCYVLATIGNLLGGLVMWLPWEVVLIMITTLLDGAVLALAFLPPLSTYFEQDRKS
jgi:hypothetical protein